MLSPYVESDWTAMIQQDFTSVMAIRKTAFSSGFSAVIARNAYGFIMEMSLLCRRTNDPDCRQKGMYWDEEYQDKEMYEWYKA